MDYAQDCLEQVIGDFIDELSSRDFQAVSRDRKEHEHCTDCYSALVQYEI